MENSLSVKFEGDDLLVFTENSKQYLSVRAVCIALGLDAKRQVRDIKNNNVLKHEVSMQAHHYAGKIRSMTFLNIEYLQGWLFKINPNSVKPEAKAKLEAYQKKCYEVLHNYFFGNKTKIDKINDERATTLMSLTGVKMEIDRNKKLQKIFQKRLLQLDKELSALISEQRHKIIDLQKQ